jgi:hypothetical protein
MSIFISIHALLLVTPRVIVVACSSLLLLFRSLSFVTPTVSVILPQRYASESNRKAIWLPNVSMPDGAVNSVTLVGHIENANFGENSGEADA